MLLPRELLMLVASFGARAAVRLARTCRAAWETHGSNPALWWLALSVKHAEKWRSLFTSGRPRPGVPALVYDTPFTKVLHAGRDSLLVHSWSGTHMILRRKSEWRKLFIPSNAMIEHHAVSPDGKWICHSGGETTCVYKVRGDKLHVALRVERELIAECAGMTNTTIVGRGKNDRFYWHNFAEGTSGAVPEPATGGRWWSRRLVAMSEDVLVFGIREKLRVQDYGGKKLAAVARPERTCAHGRHVYMLYKDARRAGRSPLHTVYTLRLVCLDARTGAKTERRVHDVEIYLESMGDLGVCASRRFVAVNAQASVLVLRAASLELLHTLADTWAQPVALADATLFFSRNGGVWAVDLE